jgi:hypothetical protein
MLIYSPISVKIIKKRSREPIDTSCGAMFPNPDEAPVRTAIHGL